MAVAKNALIRLGSREALDSPSSPREQRIEELAYFKALERGLAPGHELDDWLAAEREVNERIRRSSEE